MNLNDKVVLITGSNRGIGKSFAEMAAREHSKLVLLNRSPAGALVSELKTLGAVSVEEFQIDLSSRASIDGFLQSWGNRPVDLLFNNAGQLTGGLFEKQSMDEIASLLLVNVQAVIHLTHGLLPGMLARKSGKIVVNSSVSAIMRFPGASTYAASKAAVAAFVDCLRNELAGTGVSTLLLLTPGIETRMFQEIHKKYEGSMDTSFLTSITPEVYMGQVREAILSDREVLTPSGAQGIGLAFARHLPGLFDRFARSKFRRAD